MNRVPSLFVLLLAGCIASPQPSPPNLTPSAVAYEESATDIIDGARIVGMPGAVDPAEGAIVVTNLDEERAITAEPVRDDGSFEIIALGRPGSTFRMQARSGAARSAPFDFSVDLEAGVIVPAPRPLEDCFAVDPSYELDFGELRVGQSRELAVRIENRCGEELVLEPTRRRESDSPFAVVEDVARVAAGSAEILRIRVAPLAPGAFEATVRVEASAPMRDRRPITLFVRALE